MDELERYLARRRRRLRFAITIRDPAEPARWARLQFKVEFPIHAVLVVDGRTYESGLTDLWPAYLSLVADGSGLVDFEDRMAGAGWTSSLGHSRTSSKHCSFRRQPPPDDTPATFAAIARGAAAALLGTDQYVLTIEPYQGDSSLIGEYAGYRSLLTMGGFAVSGPIVVIVVALVTRNLSVVALVAGALVTIGVLYLRLLPRLPPSLHLDVALVKLEMAVGESAVIELPIVGPVTERVLSLAVALVGVWVPIVVAIVIASAV